MEHLCCEGYSLNRVSGESGQVHYDVDGGRIAKRVNGQLSEYLVDSGDGRAEVVMESDAANGVAYYTRGHSLLSQNRNGTTNYFHADALGSTKQLSDNSGAITDRYAYTAFGKPESQSGSTPNTYRFAGEAYDAETDSIYLRARQYQPETARFTQRDPLDGAQADPATLNDYIYAGNDPVMNVDPDGEMFFLSDFMSATSIRGIIGSTNLRSVGQVL